MITTNIVPFHHLILLGLLFPLARASTSTSTTNQRREDGDDSTSTPLVAFKPSMRTYNNKKKYPNHPSSYRKNIRAALQVEEEMSVLLDNCRAYNSALSSQGYQGFCFEPCIRVTSSSSISSFNSSSNHHPSSADIISSRLCSEGCDTCVGTLCAQWSNFTVIHEQTGSYFDFICKTFATKGSPYFGWEYCIDYAEEETDDEEQGEDHDDEKNNDNDITNILCQATLKGESCQACELRICNLDQIPITTGHFINCSNVVQGAMEDECAGIYNGVFDFDRAFNDDTLIPFPRCPSQVDEDLSDGEVILPPDNTSTPAEPTPTSPPPPASVPEEYQEFWDGCLARRDFTATYGGFLGITCGPCEYSSLIQGYSLSCQYACDECYEGKCIRSSDVTTVFSDQTDPINGGTKKRCKNVATLDSPFYGVEYCNDVDSMFEGFCESTINGLRCQSCFLQDCTTTGGHGIYIDCNNVLPDTYFDECSGEASGVFEVEQSAVRLAQSGSTLQPRCPSLLDEIPPSDLDLSATFLPPSPWKCAPTQTFANGVRCFNSENPAFPLDPSWPIQILYNCASPIMADPTLNDCDSECNIATFDDEGNRGLDCRSCTLLESGEIAYSCTIALPDLECSTRDEDLNCLVWDCLDASDFENDEYVYRCYRVGHPGYPLDAQISAQSSFSCKEPLLFEEVPSLDNCKAFCLIREVNVSVPIADSRYCEHCLALPNGEVAYDCANIFPEMECPVKGSNGSCLNESQPYAICLFQRLDGSWVCFDSESPKRGLDTPLNTGTYFVCDKEDVLFINLDECQSECFILLVEPDVVLAEVSSGITCDSCTLLLNGEIAYDCRNLLPDIDCPARDESGNCYFSTLTPSPAPFSNPSRAATMVGGQTMNVMFLLQALLIATIEIVLEN